jgi:hypothetical protein
MAILGASPVRFRASSERRKGMKTEYIIYWTTSGGTEIEMVFSSALSTTIFMDILDERNLRYRLHKIAIHELGTDHQCSDFWPKTGKTR